MSGPGPVLSPATPVAGPVGPVGPLPPLSTRPISRPRTVAIIVVVILIVIIILAVLLWLVITRWWSSTLDKYNQCIDQYCANLGPIVYDYTLYIPADPRLYEQGVANALYDIAENVSNANCTQALPLPNPPGFTNQQIVSGIDPVSKQSTMFGYIFWNADVSQAVFAFTGTSKISEWEDDLQWRLTSAKKLDGYQCGMKVHTGFYGIYTSVQEQLIDWWNSTGLTVTTLFITGHSLGGALATLAAFDFAATAAANGTTIIHYSFGSPRVGNPAFATAFNANVPNALRVNNTEDIITALPPAGWIDNQPNYTYSHVGQNLPFTIVLDNLVQNHIQAYANNLPVAAQVADSAPPPNKAVRPSIVEL